MFGGTNPTFGASSAQQSTSLFGQPAASTSTSGFGTFGQTAPTTTGLFGSTTTPAFGQPTNTAAAANPGTSIVKYQPTIGTDTLMIGGQWNSVNTKHHCIIAMKEYESKSLEELRMEDYLANRKGPQAGSTGGFGGFGTNAQPATGTGLFGATSQPSTGLFGQPAAGATETTSAFGQPATSGFGATATQTFGAKPFGATGTNTFGAAATDSSNPFGAKPAFGQTAPTSLFGQTATSAAPSFGQTTGFGGGFGTTAGQQQQQQPSLFGQPATDANKPAFGLGQASAANTGFGGFGTTATSTATGGLFGAKPATGFGTTPAFGATSQPTTGFGNFSLNNTNAGGGLFNSNLNKPATSGFGGFGTQTSTAAPLNFNTGTGQTSLFDNTAAKPGGLFGTTLGANTNTTGGGLFGQSNQSSFSLGGNQTNFGTTLGGGLNTLGGLSGIGPGTSITKYQPINGTDTVMKGGQPNSANTKHCITAMKEYENKSLEELRMEDYVANRKGTHVESIATSGFTAPSTQSSGIKPFEETGGFFGANPATESGITAAFGITSQPTTSFANFFRLLNCLHFYT